MTGSIPSRRQRILRVSAFPGKNRLVGGYRPLDRRIEILIGTVFRKHFEHACFMHGMDQRKDPQLQPVGIVS